jgi:hypothetical protein
MRNHDNNPPQSRDPKVKHFIKEVEEMCRKNKLCSNCGDKMLGRILEEASMSHAFFGGSAILERLGRTKQWYRDFVFTPEAILRETDLAGAELNLKGIELLRRVEREATNRVIPDLKKRRSNGILPSRGKKSRRTKEVHLFADYIVPIKQFQTAHGEGWTFDSLANVTKTILCGHGLDTVAHNRSVHVSLALNAAPLTKSLSLFSIALVVTDSSAKCPRTGEPLGLHSTEGK